MVQLGEHFRTVDGRNRSDWERLQRQFAKKRVDQDRREKLEDRLDDQMIALAVDVVMATEFQIQQFTARLDSYDQATVVALMENEQQLDLVRARLADMLDRAHILDDGRRVFRTEDGSQVFDEFGQEVGHDVIDPDMINPELPTWEAYSADLKLETSLEVERTEILEFQSKLDEAREFAAEDKISEADLDDMDADLMDMMPPSVRANVSDLAPASPVPKLSAAFAKPAAPLQTQIASVSAPAPSPIQ